MTWLRAYLLVPFKMLAVGIRIFMFNRAWIEARLSRKGTANSLKGLFILTMVAWLVVWRFAGDYLRGNFNEALEAWWSGRGK